MKLFYLLCIALLIVPMNVWATEDDEFIDFFSFSQRSENIALNNMQWTENGYALLPDAMEGSMEQTFNSKIDFNAASVAWVANVPEGTNMKVEVATIDANGNVNEFKVIPYSDADVQWEALYGAYCYRITMSTTVAGVSPSIQNFTFACNSIHWIHLVDTPEVFETLEAPRAVSKPSIVSRSGWGARAPNGSYTSHTPRKITIHHTYRPTAASYYGASTVRAIQNYHMDSNGWMDIGYHFLIGTYPSSGATTIYQGRPENKVGAHTGGANTNNVGVNVIGDYTYETLHSNSYKSLIHLCAWICSYYGVSPSQIYGHCDLNSTACPGNNIYKLMSKIRTDVANYNGGGGGTTGKLMGVIYDAAGGTGVRISGATVKLNTGATTTSSSTGVYTFNIAPGTYTITASKSGYQTKSAKETVIANQEVWESIGLSR
ncbi:MAG: N-acetylmuramoyl-L-alanine amidase [Planctomycetes bacterium]|jgi:hypothetical protein|nr:N-acetylmuramoyl-L-alanine amidase [Planctomycetota bacterium]HPY75135.1 N-acetylmuramoyl-L-alanine amidase [Planctomycetota bacterium]HQB00742.1 N-acetylmuramoyl-L-alanine amidase [Planctomycetota bacterium]